MKHSITRVIRALVTIGCILSILGVTSAANDYVSLGALDADLVETRALASLEFRDPGSPAQLLSSKRRMMNPSLNAKRGQSNSYAETDTAVEPEVRVSSVDSNDIARKFAHDNSYTIQAISHLEKDSQLDQHLDRLLSADNLDPAQFSNMLKGHIGAMQALDVVDPGFKEDQEDSDEQQFSMIESQSSSQHTDAAATAAATADTDMDALFAAAEGVVMTPELKKRIEAEKIYRTNKAPGEPTPSMDVRIPISKLPPLRKPKEVYTKAKIEQLELGNLRKELEALKKSDLRDVPAVHVRNTAAHIAQMHKDVDKVDGTIASPYIKKMAKDVSTLYGQYVQMQNITDRQILDMVAERKLGYSRFQPSPFEHNKAPNGRDIVDCTACRFAWLSIEKTLGNSYNPVTLYDTFVQTCSEMQLSNIFFTPCTTMFAKIDSMIANYVASMTVNQICVAAEMCR